MVKGLEAQVVFSLIMTVWVNDKRRSRWIYKVNNQLHHWCWQQGFGLGLCWSEEMELTSWNRSHKPLPTEWPTWSSELWTRKSGRRGEDCDISLHPYWDIDTLKHLHEVLAHQWRQYREQAAGIWDLCAATWLFSHWLPRHDGTAHTTVMSQGRATTV